MIEEDSEGEVEENLNKKKFWIVIPSISSFLLVGYWTLDSFKGSHSKHHFHVTFIRVDTDFCPSNLHLEATQTKKIHLESVERIA